MKSYTVALLVLALAGACTASSFVQKESFSSNSQWFGNSGWAISGRADAGHRMDMHIFVKQQNLDKLETIFWDVSNPDSANYGQYLSFNQVNDLVRPAPESLLRIISWLQKSGIEAASIESTPASDIILVKGVTVVDAERLLNTKYSTFRHASTGMEVVRTHEYSVPASVADVIDFVGPTIRLPTVAHPEFKGIKSNVAAPLDEVTPDYLRKLYNVGGYTATNPKSSMAVTGFLNQYINPDDLQTFFEQYDPSSKGRTATIVGPNEANNPGIEASLDIQYVMAMGSGIPKTTFWSTNGQQPGNPGNEPFLVWLYNVGNTTDAPLVFSISYGDNENTVHFDYAVRVNAELQKMGVRGLSIMSSSGDGGVGGGQPSFCQEFIPTYPAASPYITAVGGTTGSNPEVAGPLSSGGFSNYWARPSYQSSFVSQYFQVAQNLPPSKDYNQTGAGFPDVAAQAYNFDVVINGFTTPVDGTSCSSPTFAGLVALLNDVRLNAGKPPLGYLNQLFYKHPEAFNDITSGSNPGCFTEGFEAAAGWDPVTGLGSMDFGKWKTIVESA